MPFAGGLFSAAAGYWGEREQEKANEFLQSWLSMLEDEIREKEQTILEITARLDLHDKRIAERVRSDAFQSLLKKGFREWPAAESEEKRLLLRNVLSNAAATSVASDDVIRLFLDWLATYSIFHFEVIGAVYNSKGITRRQIWEKLGRSVVREDSAEADLFRLIIRDLSVGSVVRQHREVDYMGNFLKKPAGRRGSGAATTKSAFDNIEGYELTGLGEHFVHYAMNDLAPKIEVDR